MDDNALRRILTGRVVVAGVGNRMRCDDGVGPFTAGLIRETDTLKVVDCGETPENFMGVIIRHHPDRVLVIDTAYFGGRPGEWRFVPRSEIGGGSPSTHDAILTMFTDFIEQETGAETFFLTVQPAGTDVGEELSPEVESTGRELADAINRLAGRDLP
jgi:hydrogenase 3 maturation protease